VLGPPKIKGIKEYKSSSETRHKDQQQSERSQAAGEDLNSFASVRNFNTQWYLTV